MYLFIKVLVIFICVFSCTKNVQKKSPQKPISKLDRELLQEAQDTFGVLEKYTSKNSHKVALGKKLYLDPSLSKSGTISCNSCHNLDNFGVDNEVTSPGHDGRRGDRNSPSSFNAHLNVAQFWDGRAKDLKEQALGPLLNPIEHGLASKEETIKIISTKSYSDAFKKSYNTENSLTFENIGDAIAEFEKTLITPGKFDEYLKGDILALSALERRGLKKFIEVGCTSCHYGAALGGQDYHKLGLVESYPTKDLGRYNVTKDEDDKYVFKVPNLRNIEKTAPYFHDGHVKTLDEAVKLMAKHQLGEELEKKDINEIVTFLKALTGKL